VIPGTSVPIPLSVLTGFLGAGKTTLLNRLISDPALAETAVIINEFGEIGLDHLLVRKIDEGVVLMQSGCLCCTLRGDLIEALTQLLRDLDNGRLTFRRIMIETTGLADAAPVLQTLMTHPYLVQRLRLDGVITVVDAVNGNATLDEHVEAVKQIAVADRIVLTKTDLLAGNESARAALYARIRALNPAAPILEAADVAATSLVDCGLFDPARKSPDVRAWLNAEAYAAQPHHHHARTHDPNRHDERIRAFTLTTDIPIPAATFEMFIDLLRSLHGAKLLRLKGIVRIAEESERPVVIHGVQHVMHPPVRLPSWPDQDKRTRIVLITRDLSAGMVEPLFKAFLNQAAPDQADRAAVLDNPLIPFGGRDR
jgi:G3E family GTPase